MPTIKKIHTPKDGSGLRARLSAGSHLEPKVLPYLLIAPVVILILLLYGYPMIVLFSQSLSKVSLINGSSKFIGLANYKALLSDASFYTSLHITLKYTLVTVILKIGFGFILALFLAHKLYAAGVLRFGALLPWALPQVVVALLWKWILDSNYGYLNYLLQALHITDKNVAWLSQPTTAFWSASIVDTWLGISFIAMMFLAALQSISPSLYEAAEVDGAGALRKFWHITLPGIKKVFLVSTLLVSIWTFNSFNVIFALTGGGPFRSTETLVIKIYQEAYANFNIGLSSALSVLVFLFLMVLITLFYRLMERE